MSCQSKAANKARSFNSLMHVANEYWAAKVLGMQVNPFKGPDLLDDNKIVEIKFKLVYPEGYTHISWRVLGFQLGYEKQEGKIGYWGLGEYWLSKPVSEIKTEEESKLESLVTKRELFIVPWNWMSQFPVYTQTGKTKISEWDNQIIFAKGSLLPEIKRTYDTIRGKIHLTEGVSLDEFAFPG